MSGIAVQRGETSVKGAGWTARVLPGAPLIAPVRAYTFPLAVAGEEDALARGALWVEVRVEGQQTFVAQCALGYATGGVAQGLWLCGDGLLAVAGGYGYAVDVRTPAKTEFLLPRPVVEVAVCGEAAVLVGFHGVFVLADGKGWMSSRLSWEGVTVTGCEGGVLRGMGWDMTTDEEVPFVLDLRTREARGGGYRVG